MLQRLAAETMPQPDVECISKLFMLRDELRARHDPEKHPTPVIDALITTWVDADHGTVPGGPQPLVAPGESAAVPATDANHAAPEGTESLAEPYQQFAPADSDGASDHAPAENAPAASEESEAAESESAAAALAVHAEFTEGESPLAASGFETQGESADALAHAPADFPQGPTHDATHASGDVPANETAHLPAAGELAPAHEAFEPSAIEPAAEPLLPEAPIVRPERAPLPLGAAIRSSERVRDEIDPELIEVFLQEASEYMPQISENLRQWQANPADLSFPQALMRHMHTVKGSARMAGAMRLGEVVHEMETRVESGLTLREIPPGTFEELLAMHDRATELYDGLMRPGDAAEVTPEHAQGDDAAARDETQAEAEHALSPEEATAAMSVPATAIHAQAPRTLARGAAQPQAAGAVVQAVRVRADVLDRLVNQAGEVSISRSRLENEVSQIRTSLGDLTENLARLRSQLREIEIQAETQMQSQLSMVKERERFDPLEFDRFTRLQELTRMMAESVSDVGTVQQNLVRSLDGATRDLSSQQRMTRDLQQDLMRVRMVPFSSVSERLYRVVRQSAKELDKRVNLDIRGGGVEIDRSVLERMAAPFEHLLRNAIVHGVETRAERLAKGKSETGELLVEVRQEGNEIVLVFSDDGAGLNVERIREKARATGLLAHDEELVDARIADLIFQPGFTTASEVTELAGRGVGMDVVRAEAGGLGGRVSVDSIPDHGTRFTINLPLTLAVTQVVLVTVAGRTYALPSVLVEQVQQVRPQPLAQAYNDGHVMWLNQPVKLYFLAGLLGEADRSPIAQRYSPLLILRSGGDRVAVHVDEVVGNQEVVVKNIGPQLARMSGIAGATVLGSGDIVLILNPVQLAQQIERERVLQVVAEPLIGGAVAELITPEPVKPRSEPVAGLETLPTVMVVDDSLTVRRVTQRLLTREGYQVVLAKDGVDALQQLQDYTPDVMLVDIEMPRMDGFDLTRNVRGDERYAKIPIVMITSRTADKHREFAMELGVNVYLGKPYQEDELLGHLARFTGAKRRATA
jgi:chemosensory pili system protein ChpA (sensor histidine kinase/response regulator)